MHRDDCPSTAAEPLRDIIGRAIYEQPKFDGSTDDWYALSEHGREPWRVDADRVIAACGHLDFRRVRAALLWTLGHIETTEEPDIDKLHDAIAWGLGKVDIRNSVLRGDLEGRAINSLAKSDPEVQSGGPGDDVR